MNTHTNAARFFWAWLAASTAASVLGNVTHALLDADAANPAIAAAVAVVPPTVLLGATHGVHALVRSSIVGAAYRAALAITIAVALAAFVLSFAALRELAIVQAGMSPMIAWLVPVVVDLSITGSTVALLALSGAQRAAMVTAEPAEPEREPMSWVERQEVLREAFGPDAHRDAQVHLGVQPTVRDGEHVIDVVQVVDSPADFAPGVVSVADLIARDAAEQVRGAVPITPEHFAAAERMVEQGVTRIDRMKIAEVLAEHDGGTAPSMIARKVGVGYTTVVRILEHHAAQDDAPVRDAEAVPA